MIKKLMTLLVLLVALVLAVLGGAMGVVAGVGMALGGDPGHASVEASAVHEIDGVAMLEMAGGRYVVNGDAGGGCYALEAGADGEYGTARWVWPWCPKGGD